MTGHELARQLLRFPDVEVELQVGGDGAIHESPVRQVFMSDGQTVTLSGERS